MPHLSKQYNLTNLFLNIHYKKYNFIYENQFNFLMIFFLFNLIFIRYH